jgi:arsenite methyltransferase
MPATIGIFPTGRPWAEELGYPEPALSCVPDATVESFAGVANPWTLGSIERARIDIWTG